MSYLRVVYKLLGFLLLTLFIYSMIMVTLLTSVLGVNYEKYRGYLLRSWGHWSCWILGLRVDVINSPPEPPFLLVSNHLSYTDIFVLFSQLRCLFVAKNDVKTWPFVGFIVRTCGILFIDRNRKRDVTRVNRNISKNINDNQGIIIFPEGTTSPGMDVLPFRSSLLEYPATKNFEVSYVSIRYSVEEGPEEAYLKVCWWDDTPFFVHFIHFLKLKRIKATVTFGKDKIREQDRKSLAIKLHEAIRSEFEPMIDEQTFTSRHESFTPALPL